MIYNLSYEIAGLMILVLTIVFFLLKKSYPSGANRMFLILCICGALACLTDIVGSYCIMHKESMPLPVLYGTLMATYFTVNAVPFFFLMYIMMTVWRVRPVRYPIVNFLVATGLLEAGLICSTPLTHWIFYFDEQKNYLYGQYQVVVYVIAFAVILLCLVEAILNRKILNKLQGLSVYFMTASNLVAMIIQYYHPETILTTFFIAIALLMVYVSMQNADDSRDRFTGVFNHTSFSDTLKQQLHSKADCDVVVVKIAEFDVINAIFGIDKGDLVLKLLAEHMRNIAPNHEAYRISGLKFAVIFRGDHRVEHREAFIDDIDAFCKQSAYLWNLDVTLIPVYAVVSRTDKIATLLDFERSIQYCLDRAILENGRKIFYSDLEIAEKVQTQNAIQTILQTALHDGKYEIYYQPILNLETGKFDSAEALLRLKDEALGFISPEVFIPMTEENGQIIGLGEFVFHGVCGMMVKQNLRQYGVRYIEINLSAVQCMQKDLAIRFREIVGEYDLPPASINFELTETATVQSSETLCSLMDSAIADGFTFSLDDYGSGMASVNYLMKYPFSMVKLDKNLVWNGCSDERAAVVLSHTVSMIKSLNMKIVAEGVETEEQATELQKMGCDYFQGYLYSKPLPEQEYIEFLRTHQHKYADAV